jgi:hypothetical protein
MPDGFLLSRVLLTFESDAEDLWGELSAIALTPDGNLWVGSDEYVTVERLSPLGNGVYGSHKAFHLNDYIDLHDTESEIDIEGLDYSEGYLWVIGSHSLKRNKTRGKKVKKDIQRLAEIERDPNRYLLARIPVVNGELVSSVAHSDVAETQRSADMLHPRGDRNILIDALLEDDHIGPFLQAQIPSKDNGLDIEGLAVCEQRVFLGLRGPVLRGWAIILELELEAQIPGRLNFKELEEGKLYRKHFIDLNGLGVRELCLHQDDLIILAGPTMDLEGTMQVFRLKDVLDHSQDTLWDQESGALSVLFDLPVTIGADHAEGLTLFPCFGDQTGLMVAYDSPSEMRLVGERSIFIDVFRLPD